MVTAADRAAATCQRWVTTNDRKRAGEGFQRAIAKPPDGLRPLVVPAGTKSRVRRRTPPRTVAAALSAAVTSTNSQKSTPTFQAEPTKQKHTPPNASRSSGGSAREGLLSEKPPPSHTPVRFHSSGGGPGEALLLEKRPPRSSPTCVFREGSAREGTFLQKSPLPRSSPSLFFIFLLYLTGGGWECGRKGKDFWTRRSG